MSERLKWRGGSAGETGKRDAEAVTTPNMYVYRSTYRYSCGAGALIHWVLPAAAAGGPRLTTSAAAVATLENTHTYTQCHTVRAERRYHGEAAADPDRRDDPVLLRWRTNRCRARSQQTVRALKRQKE